MNPEALKTPGADGIEPMMALEGDESQEVVTLASDTVGHHNYPEMSQEEIESRLQKLFETAATLS